MELLTIGRIRRAVKLQKHFWKNKWTVWKKDKWTVWKKDKWTVWKKNKWTVWKKDKWRRNGSGSQNIALLERMKELPLHIV